MKLKKSLLALAGALCAASLMHGSAIAGHAVALIAKLYDTPKSVIDNVRAIMVAK